MALAASEVQFRRGLAQARPDMPLPAEFEKKLWAAADQLWTNSARIFTIKSAGSSS